MSLQTHFRRFEEKIRLTRLKENAELLSKGDKILKRLRESRPPGVPTFGVFYQGSYEMGTGIKPLDGDYDIDIGVVFNMDHKQHDPVTVKGWVYDIVKSHTALVKWREPCITVYYQEGGEPKYHVDLAVFAKNPASGQTWLAIGKQGATGNQQKWQRDDRIGFSEAVDLKFSGEGGVQFCRVVRYLKRWKDVHFPRQGHAAPTGFALTVAAYKWFQPLSITRGGVTEEDDLGALIGVVNSMRQSFGPPPQRLSLHFPNEPRDDVFKRMNEQQMLEFRLRLDQLKDWLDEARKKNIGAPLRSAFGDDFPQT